MAIVAGVGGLAVGAAGWLSRIEPLLPAVDDATCFAGSFDGSESLRRGFPHERRTDAVRVTGMALRLDRARRVDRRSLAGIAHYPKMSVVMPTYQPPASRA